MKIKLLVNTPENKQELISIHISGNYYDESKVLWDERVDGNFPLEFIEYIGALKLVDNELLVDDDMLNQLELDKLVEEEEALLKECYDNRRNEYPSIEECIEAILDDGLEDLQIKRQAVKVKYPKP